MAAHETASHQVTLNRKHINHPHTRKSYTREHKLKVMSFYFGHNLCQRAKQLLLNTRMVGHWIVDDHELHSFGGEWSSQVFLPMLVMLV